MGNNQIFLKHLKGNHIFHNHLQLIEMVKQIWNNQILMKMVMKLFMGFLYERSLKYQVSKYGELNGR